MFEETQRTRRGHAFYPPASLAVPKLYATESTPAAEKVIQVHYFVGGCDWWIAEYDPTDGRAFGYACLGSRVGAEWGYTSLPELEELSVGPGGFYVVERDIHWTPKRFRECRHACDSGLAS